MRKHRGFTLVELMVTVAIITILVVVAVVSWRKYVVRVRLTEVTAMFAEIRAKQEAYRAEFQTYYHISTSENELTPALSATVNVEPIPKDWPTADNRWNRNGLGITPFRSQVYCGYAVLAGPANDISRVNAIQVSKMLGATVPTTPWWAAVAQCDSDGVPGDLASGNNHLFVTSFRTPAIVEYNPGR